MSGTDLAFAVYTAFMILSAAASYCFGAKLIKKTGLFGAQAFLGMMAHLLLGMAVIAGWGFYSFGVNEFLFIGGLLFGIGALAVSEILLIALLLIRRKPLLKAFVEG